MNLFINNCHFRLITPKELIYSKTPITFDAIYDASIEVVPYKKLAGNVLITNMDLYTLDKLWRFLYQNETFHVVSLLMVTKNIEELEYRIKSYYKIVKAAGGIVQKDDKVLMINRLGFWDFPKGKLEKNETFEQAALREVAEECGVKTTLNRKIITTWHSYTDSGLYYSTLKRTKWYLLDCVSDEQMIPQTEEGIDEVVWKTHQEAEKLLSRSFHSLKFLWKSFKDVSPVLIENQ